MKNLEKELCKVMHKFVKEHIDEVKDSYSNLGFKDSVDMLKQIKGNIEVAVWSLFELLDWGLSKNYRVDFLYEAYATNNDEDVYLIKDSDGKKRFFVVDYDEMRPFEVEQKKEKIEVIRWKLKKVN